jgi:hypothetical protein
MPQSKKSAQAPEAPEAKTPVATTPVDATVPDTADDKKNVHLKKLQNQLKHNASFMRMMGWTVGLMGAIMAVPYVTGIIEAFVWPIMKLPFWYLGVANWPFGGAGPLTNALTSLIFGTQTTSGFPIALVKGLLPAFMAPMAVWVAFGVPLLLFAYQYAYVNWNENLFAPKPNAAALDRDRKKGQPEVKESNEPKQKPDNTTNPAQAPATTSAPNPTVQQPQQPVSKGSPILNGFKSKVQATKEARARNGKAAKAAPKRAVTKKAVSKKVTAKKAAPKKAAPRKPAPKKALKRKTRATVPAPKKRTRRKIN